MTESIMDRLLNPRPVAMRPLTPRERKFLVAAWVELESVITGLREVRKHECGDEMMITDDSIDDCLQLINHILWCFPEVRFAPAGETFSMGDAPKRKKPGPNATKLPVCSVIGLVKETLGKKWSQETTERIESESE